MVGKVNDFWYSEYQTEDVKLSWNISEVLCDEKSPFQHIIFMKNNTVGTFFTLDGFVMLTEKEEFIYHDMIAHPAFAVHPRIKNVLIIGGGDGGSVREVSRYPFVERIDMVEIDERVVRLSQKYIPQTAGKLDNDSRLNLYFQDGLKFVADANPGSYDLIIVDSTDPVVGPGGSLFTLDFYENCERILTDDGILINQHESAYYEKDRLEMIKAHEKIKKIFPIAKVYGFNSPSYSSGYWYFGFASKKYHPLTDHNPSRWESYGLDTKYYNSELHKGAFALPNYVKRILESNL